jgi:acetolactate synthase-1/2/3 large subunit
MNVSDEIWARLKSEVGVVFFLPGGGCAYLVDALGRSGIKYVSCLHEAGAGFAAVGYAQHHGFGVCLTTSGPGATNAITPCLAAWMDSVPVLFISGQVQTKWLMMAGMRSRGTQEADIISIVKPITKRAFRASALGKDLSHIIDRMIFEAKNGRPGPVWLDVEMNIQVADV